MSVTEYEVVDERRRDIEMQQNVSYGNSQPTAQPTKKKVARNDKFKLFQCSIITWCAILTVLVLAALILSAWSLTVSSDIGSCQCSQEKQVSRLI